MSAPGIERRVDGDMVRYYRHGVLVRTHVLRHGREVDPATLLVARRVAPQLTWSAPVSPGEVAQALIDNAAPPADIREIRRGPDDRSV